MLVADEAANLAAPAVTCEAGRLWAVLVAVSTALAVKYVLPYSKQMRAKGLPNKICCGRRKSVAKEDFSEPARVLAPEAFSIMERSMMAMRGATMEAAVKPLTASAARRRPRCFVLYCGLAVEAAVEAAVVEEKVVVAIVDEEESTGARFENGEGGMEA